MQFQCRWWVVQASKLVWSIVLTCFLAQSSTVAKSDETAQQVTIAPSFEARDISGVICKLTNFKNKGCTIYFFCGCHWCKDCARALSHIQQSSTAPKRNAGTLSQTVIVFAGDALTARTFTEGAGVDLKRVLLIPDPDSRITRL